MKKVLFSILLFCFFSPINRVETPNIVALAQLSQSECGIPASIVLAQAITESGGGVSNLAKLSNNWFGIKAYSNWKGETCGNYRAYSSIAHSFQDHATFLHDNYINAVGKDWEYWVKNCRGYGGAGYWKHIGKVIQQYKLYQYDL